MRAKVIQLDKCEFMLTELSNQTLTKLKQLKIGQFPKMRKNCVASLELWGTTGNLSGIMQKL
jgi:hypothetical protein